MIELKINKGNVTASVLGNIQEITSELLVGIESVHDNIAERSTKCANVMKECIIQAVNDGICFESGDKKIKSKSKDKDKNKKSDDDDLRKELLKMIKDILGDDEYED